MEPVKLSSHEYELLIEQAPIMIWRANTSTECDYFNERWLTFTGRTMEQEMGNGWAEGVHPDDFQHCLDVYLTAFRKHEAFEMDRPTPQARWGIPLAIRPWCADLRS